MRAHVLLFFSLFVCFGRDELFGEETRRLERTSLLVYRDNAGVIRPVTDVSKWRFRRDAVLAGMREIMGSLPGMERRTDLEPRVEQEVDAGDYVRRYLTYQSEPGSRTPAFLLIPKKALHATEASFPAVLCLHPTHSEGHKTVVGATADVHAAYAAELARRGFVTIAPAYPLLANYQPDLKSLGYASGSMKAVWDNVRALDLLESFPFVKRNGFGAIGHSLGGHNAIYTSVFDERIKAVVSSCGFDSYLHYYSGDAKVWRPGNGWTQERYMPRLANYAGRLAEIPFDFHELIGALAPRPVFVNAPMHDSNFQAWSVDEIVAAAKPVYNLYGAADQLRVEHPDCGHDFPLSIRERAYEFLEENLR